MKRKYDQDTGYCENPTKYLVREDEIMYMNNSYIHPAQSPLIGQPPLASTPQPHDVNISSRLVHFTGALQTRLTPDVINMSREAELRRVIESFVGIYEQLDKTNDGTVKPNYSYTELAFLAMLRSPNFCLPINEIYK